MNLERLTSINGFLTLGNVIASDGSRTGIALDSAYVHGTSGDAVGWRYCCQSDEAITEFYCFVIAFQDLANVTMQCTIRDGATNTLRPGSVLATSNATVLPAGDGMWAKFTFAGYTPAVNEILWFVVENTSADPTNDYPTVMSATNTFFTTSYAFQHILPYTNTAGFSTNGTVSTEIPFIIKQNSFYVSQPFTQFTSSFYTSNKLERGIVITSEEDIQISGVRMSPSSTYDKFRILKSTTAPGAAVGAGELEIDLDAGGIFNDQIGAATFAPFTLVGGRKYYITLTFTANATVPNVWQIEDYSSYSSVFDAIRAYSPIVGVPSVIDDGAGGWTEDNSVAPFIALLVSGYPAISSGAFVTQQIGIGIR